MVVSVAARKVTVILTEHFKQRYRERVGSASPSAQQSWLARTLAVRRPKRYDGGKFTVKLVGSDHVAVLAWEKGVWVAITVK